MKLSERAIFARLVDEALRDGFQVVRFACQPATGEPGDEINAQGRPLSISECLEHARAWDADSILELARPRDWARFWVVLVWGNGEDVISDYRATAEADRIMERVYAWIEDREPNPPPASPGAALLAPDQNARATGQFDAPPLPPGAFDAPSARCDDPGAHGPGCQCDGGEPVL